MRAWLLCGCFFFFACGVEPEKTAVTLPAPDTAATIIRPDTPEIAIDVDASLAKNDALTEEPPPPPAIKNPSGIYRFLLPAEEGDKILHTISFSPGTFRLQEEYTDKKDSTVITEGTWSPTRDFIWLYKDQVVRGRYTWQGDTLQYYSPRLKKTFAMKRLTPVRTSDVWQTKRAGGAALFAIGNEPFWSVEITGEDSLVIRMPDWHTPLRVKAKATSKTADSVVYTAVNDSISVSAYPLFCNDGMSDFLYTQKIKLVYKGQYFNGCGERFLAAN